MAWTKSHQELERHPKLLKFVSLMGVNKNEAIGLLHRFWWWVADYAEDGDLTKYPYEVIGGSVGLPENSARTFTRALIEAGFIDLKPFYVCTTGGNIMDQCFKANINAILNMP